MKIITVGHFYSVGDFRLVILFLVWDSFFVMHFIAVDISAMSNTQRGMVLAFTTVVTSLNGGRSEIDSAWYRSRYPWDYWFVLIFNNSRPNKEISKRLIWPTEPSKWLYLGYSNTNTPTVVDQYGHPTYKISIAYKMGVLCGQIFSWIYLVS